MKGEKNMFCRNCGKEIDNNIVSCPYCNTYVASTQQQDDFKDSGSVGWSFLGCCIPLVGLILYLVWKDTKPLCAKKAGIGAAIGVAVYVLLSIVFFIFTIYLFAAIGNYPYYYY